MFLNGFLIASLLYFRMQDTYENGLFSSIKTNIDSSLDKDDNTDSLVVKAMHETHLLMKNRAPVFSPTGSASLGVQADFLHPTSVDLMTSRGACGSYSQVLARILVDYNLPVRIAQMKANGMFAAHNIVEVNPNNHWVVLDPTFDAAFIKPDGSLASFADVHNDWSFYAKQVPPGYDGSYRYEDVRYSNWTKIPLVLPALKGLLNLTIGREKADHISIRTWFLRIYFVYFYIALLIWLLLVLHTLRRLVRLKIFPDPQTPFTLRNLLKYSGAVIARNKPDTIR